MDLSEYIREILKKIPEKINIKSPDPGQVVMYLVLGILGVFVFITIIRPVASFFMDRRKRNKIISKGMLFWKDFEKNWISSLSLIHIYGKKSRLVFWEPPRQIL